MKNLITKAALCLMVIASLTSCRKALDKLIGHETPSGKFVHYTIASGNHYSDKSSMATGEFTGISFVARFDSSAVYKTEQPGNQHDINKLYGFSDNNSSHQQYSARIGWRWSDGALRLFAYVYNEGRQTNKEITTVRIGSDINCSIRIDRDQYIFTVDGSTVTMPRTSQGETAKGYRLYPYFGGDETAPHDIHIWIKEL